MVRLQPGFLLCAGVLTLFACSGGGGSSVAPRPTPSASGLTGPNGSGVTPSLTQTVSFTVIVPSSATLQAIARRSLAARRRPQDGTTPYISPNIASIGIQLLAVDGISLATAPPAPTVSNITCPTPGTGCSINVGGVVAAVGTNRYLVSTYTLPGGAATLNNVVISSQLLDVVVTANGTVNTTLGDPSKLAIGGYVNSLVLSSTQSPNPLLLGEPGSGTIVVDAKDVSGATIVGNAQFPNPIVVSAIGVTLSGSGLRSDGSVVLTMPETQSNVIGFSYAGTGQTITVSATTTAQNGSSVAAIPLSIPVTTPTPPPAASPTPPPLPSLYVLNAGNNSLVEYALSANGIPTAVRRVLTGSKFGCPTSLTPNSDPADSSRYGFGLTGLTIDAAGVVYAATSGDTCADGTARLFAVSPSTIAGAAIANNDLSRIEVASIGPDLELQYDASAGAIDVSRASGGSLSGPNGNYAYAQVAYSGKSGGVVSVPNVFGGADASAGNSIPCFNSSGFGTVVTGCTALDNTAGGGSQFYGLFFTNSYLTFPAVVTDNFPLAVDGMGTTYFATDDASFQFDPNSSLTLSSNSIAIASFANAKNHGALSNPVPGVANPTWIEGLDTLVDPVQATVAMTYDPTTHRLYVLQAANAMPGGYWKLVGAPMPATNARPDFCSDATGSVDPVFPLCVDGNPHYYIVGFDMSAAPIAEPCTACAYPAGALDLPPVLVIGGDALHLPPFGDYNGLYPFGRNLVPQNGLTAYNGKLYLTNPIGPLCDAACHLAETSGLASSAGEIDVYDGTATGYFNDGNPGNVLLSAFKDANIAVPVGVTAGKAGTATTALGGRAPGMAPVNLPIRAHPTRFTHLGRRR